MSDNIENFIQLTSGHKNIAVIGSRGYSDYEHFSAWVKHHTGHIKKPCFVSGGAKSGADSLIERYADEFIFPILVFYPEYGKYGKSAPLKRNHSIVLASDCLLAFWDGVSTGTAYTLDLAYKKGIPVKIIKV